LPPRWKAKSKRQAFPLQAPKKRGNKLTVAERAGNICWSTAA
jgi:hypothetical protein